MSLIAASRRTSRSRYWIAFSNWRWKFLVEAVVALPIVLPPTVLGFYVLVALGPRSPLGRWWVSMTGHSLAFTFTGSRYRIDPVQPALCRATFCVVVCRCGSEIDRGVVDSRCIPHPHFLPCDSTHLDSRHRYGRYSELCPYDGRIRRGADGRRKYPGGHTDDFHRYL